MVHRLRTVLAIVSAATGIAGVVVLTAVGDGARREMLGRIERLGRNTLVISAARIEPRAGRRRQGEGRAISLRADDATAVANASPSILRAAAIQDRDMRARFGRVESPATILGTTPDWFQIRRFELAAGRFFSFAENADRARVAVLGADVRTSLFPDSIDPIGRTIRIGRVPFVVIGWLQPRGASIVGAASEDDRIIVPLETALRRVFNRDDLAMILLEAASSSSMPMAERDAAGVLRVRHDIPPGSPDDFDISNPLILMATEIAANASFQRLMTGLGGLSVFVGGAGIFAMMLLTVRERRAEIGLRIAVGARRRDIALQFLTEALLIALAAGFLGFSCALAGMTAASATSSWSVHASAPAFARAAASILALGILAGTIPALRAASLDPIVALRSS
jgi:putative ABC transport system permease protein